MILVDTSIWVDHLRVTDPALTALLEADKVVSHAFVIGELACGNLRRRQEILSLLHDLPQADIAEEKEVLHLIDHHRLMGSGIGYVDAHLLASTLLTDSLRLWSRDRRVTDIALRLKISFPN